MLRQNSGSVLCPGCKTLVGVQDERCLNCGRWNPGLWGFAPFLSRFGRDLGFTPFVMGACAVLYAATLFVDRNGIQFGGFNFLGPSSDSLFMFGASGLYPVFGYGRWWTVLTAGWLHGGLLHIGFNMMSLRNIAPSVAELYGPSRMAIIYTVAGVAGFVVSTIGGAYLGFIPGFGGGGFTVGASASIMGLIGSILYYGRRTGSRAASEQAKQWIIYIFVFGFIVRGIDNWAHLGGLGGGYLCARILDPLMPERLDHLMIALGCFAITAVAIIYSVITWVQ